MALYDRRQKLLDLLRREPGIGVPQIAERLGVSQGTVRNDLSALEQQNLVIRLHGSAILKSPSATQSTDSLSSAFKSRLQLNQKAKQAIARIAVREVEDGDAILMDASTTVYYLAPFLLAYRNLRIVTNCLETARLLSQNPTHIVMLVGGILRSGAESVIGPWAERSLEGLCARIAFVSCSGFTPEGGMTEVDMFESEFRLKAVQSAEKTIALVDSSKFGKIDLTPSLQPAQIHLLLTDSELNKNWQERLMQCGYNFQICPIEEH